MERAQYHGQLDIKLDREELIVLAKALKSFTADDKTTEDFEKEYGCKLVKDITGYGIKDVVFHNDSNKTMFMLKYKL